MLSRSSRLDYQTGTGAQQCWFADKPDMPDTEHSAAAPKRPWKLAPGRHTTLHQHYNTHTWLTGAPNRVHTIPTLPLSSDRQQACSSTSEALAESSFATARSTHDELFSFRQSAYRDGHHAGCLGVFTWESFLQWEV